MRPSGDPQIWENRRKKAIQLWKSGNSQTDVARLVNVGSRTVRRWIFSYRRKGNAGIKARPSMGRPTRLNVNRRKKLEQMLLKGAKRAGFSTDLWTCPRVAKTIHSCFGISYHVDHICRLLHSLGWSPQKPERRAIERDEAKIRTWKRIHLPHIKKKPVG